MIEIYTDGACWPNPSANGGWGFVAYANGAEIHTANGAAEGLTTNNRMEMTAMLRAMMWLGGRPGRIHSDSQYVVNGLNSWCKGWERRGWMRKDKGAMVPVMNADLWQVMVIARMPQHQIQWVKGHAGIMGNERADQLADAACRGVAA
ncbi:MULTISPECIES: ribonuclease H [unclassified Variovorax]|uniref:ribonuclease H family protein n=1 Tax=unclassified Variovorax TaxID=663243 RepID=UPI00076BCF70|nr:MULTISPECIES: ribonuclease H [unclassified Variovorax]KWT72262.1 Ribonuclease HI [Variovorax sp. WDL1]PNG53209.1 Ribonuclease HI [Variovorax sp. B2]PNG53781.1 Ribonuclease HI [Variovorax sp. B4]VTV11236.1 Ribonuclease HI [Variovorax sp. WDL1]